MSALKSVKHVIGEVEGVRCSIVETGISKDRALFLSELLKYNGLEVKMQSEPSSGDNSQPLYVIGVTDIVFNAVYKVYERVLKRPDGKVVSPAYWRQESGDTTGWYWTFGKSMEPDYYE